MKQRFLLYPKIAKIKIIDIVYIKPIAYLCAQFQQKTVH